MFRIDRDKQGRPILCERELMRMTANGNGLHHCIGGGVDHRDGILSFVRDRHELPVRGDGHAVRVLAGLDIGNLLHRVHVNHRHDVGIEVCDVGTRGRRL